MNPLIGGTTPDDKPYIHVYKVALQCHIYKFMCVLYVTIIIKQYKSMIFWSSGNMGAITWRREGDKQHK